MTVVSVQTWEIRLRPPSFGEHPVRGSLGLIKIRILFSVYLMGH